MLCTADKAYICKLAEVKTCSSLGGEMGTTPYASISVMVCEGGSYKVYMPSIKFDTDPTTYKMSSNRVGSLTVGAVSRKPGDKLSGKLEGVELFLNGDSTTPKKTVTAEFTNLEVFAETPASTP
jgi:hypothetical protein